MTFKKVHRKEHHQRAERLEVRFSPTWTGDPTVPTTAVVPNSPVPAPAAVSTRPAVAAPQPVVPAPVPVKPTTTAPPAVVPSTTAPVVAPPVVPAASSSSSSSSAVIVPPPASSSSSSSVVVKTTPAVVAAPTSKTTPLATPSTFRSLPLSSLTPTTISSASPSATSTTSSGMATGSIVGIAAASVAGVAVVGAVGIWLLKRYFNSRDHDDPNSQFQRHSWMRNSVALPDDTPSPIVRGPSESPRPPTMIERKQTHNYSNVGASRAAYPQDNNVGMAYSDYQDSYGTAPMPSFNPGQHIGTPSPNSAQAFFSPIASPAPPGSPGVASFDETMPAMQHASYNPAVGSPVYFSRHDSNMGPAQPDSAALPVTPNAHSSVGTDADGYATLDRSSVTPYQAQQYAEISRQLQTERSLAPVAETHTAPHTDEEYIAQGHGASPFEDPALGHEEQYQELTLPVPAHARVDSTPPMLPPMRAMSPVGAVGARASFAQLTHAFPAAPGSPARPAFPPSVAGSPKSPSFKQAPPLSPAVAQKGQVVSVPESVHAGRETPVQFGFNNPSPAPAEPKAVRRVSLAPSAKRMSVASRKSIAKSGRPETMYDEEDAYGGI